MKIVKCAPAAQKYGPNSQGTIKEKIHYSTIFYENATCFQGRCRTSGVFDPCGIGLIPGFLPIPNPAGIQHLGSPVTALETGIS